MRGASRPVARRGLDVIGPHLAADLAEPDLLRVVEEAVLEDHLHERAPLVRRGRHGRDVGGHGVPCSADRLADVDDHVELGCAVVHGCLRLEDLHLRGVAAVGEPDGGPHRDLRPPEQAGGLADGVRLDADARHAVFRGELAALLELLVRQGGSQQRVIDPPGDQVVGQYKSHGAASPTSRIPRLDRSGPRFCLLLGVPGKGGRGADPACTTMIRHLRAVVFVQCQEEDGGWPQDAGASAPRLTAGS